MNDPAEMPRERIEKTCRRLLVETERAGYYLNPDIEFTQDLVRGLLTNEDRYGYWLCPCRLTEGSRKEDLDIICPCDYRDPDLDEYGTCYCALYVSREVNEGTMKIGRIPERRPPKEQRENSSPQNAHKASGKMPVWRCKVCGYLCARENPPGRCPVCKADKDRFESFAL